MRKMAKNRQNFTVKKNVTFLFLIRFGWNLNSILTLSKASFLLIFSILGLKKQKLRFFKGLTKWDTYTLYVYKNQYTFNIRVNRKKPDLKILNTSKVIPPQRWAWTGWIYEFYLFTSSNSQSHPRILIGRRLIIYSVRRVWRRKYDWALAFTKERYSELD